MIVFLEVTPWGWLDSSADERLPARVASSVESRAACLTARSGGVGRAGQRSIRLEEVLRG